MSKKAIVSSGIVENIIELDDGAAFDPGDGKVLIPFTEACEIGGTWDGEAFQPLPAPPPPDLTEEDVNKERDRRIDSGFEFEGVLFQSRLGDRENIAGAKSQATDAIAAGAEEGELNWQQRLDPTNGAATFAWIATDNSLVPMDAQAVVRLGYAALAHKQRMIFAGRLLKAMDPIPADYAEDGHW